MSSQLVEIEQDHAIPARLEADLGAARDYARASLSENTLRAYRVGLEDFAAWCADREAQPFPAAPDRVAAYLAACADRGLSVSTIGLRVAAIRWMHESRGVESPTGSKSVTSTLAGIRRRLGVAQTRKAPATSDRVKRMAARISGDDVKSKRDRALLLVGFALAARRSELVALEVADIEESNDGLLVTIRRSKADQEARGVTLGIPFGLERESCPVLALRAWLEAAGIVDGPIFRNVDRHGRIGGGLTGHSVARIVKDYAEAAGLDGDFSAHSLRAGFITSAAEKGVQPVRIMDHSRHKSFEVLRGYIRRTEIFKDHAGAGLL